MGNKWAVITDRVLAAELLTEFYLRAASEGKMQQALAIYRKRQEFLQSMQERGGWNR